MADRSVKGTGASNNRSVAGTGGAYTKDTTTTNNGNPGSGYSKSSGSPRKSSSSTPDDKKQQKKTQAQLDNTAGNYAQRKKDLDKESEAQLGNINQQIEANNALLKQQNVQNQRNIAWQPNQQKEQSTMMAMRNRMGNAAYGSGIVDLMEGMGRVDDMNDVELINTYKQNSDNAYNNWFQANESLISDYNDQVTSINDEYSKLYSQYWSTMSNINPELATKENLDKAAKNASATSKANVQSAKDTVSSAKNQLAMAKRNAKASKNSKTAKAQVKAAQKAYDKAKKSYTKAKSKDTVTVGKGAEEYTLPNVDLSPSASLSKMLQAKSNASEVNPATRDYIRPDKSTTSLGGNRGDFNNEGQANSAFEDNLRAFRNIGRTPPTSAEQRAQGNAARNRSNVSLQKHNENVARQQALQRQQEARKLDRRNRDIARNNANMDRAMRLNRR